jgi:uncharacterized membrane protein
MTGEVATRVVSKVAPRSGFFVYMSLGFLAIALIGFSTTLFLPLARGTFVAPPVIYVHGALVFSWLIFFIAQASLIRVRNVSVHRRLGWLGAALAVAVVSSGVAVSLHVMRRELAAGGGDDVLRAFLGNLIAILTFGSLVAAAVVLRRDSESHKRLLLLAAIWVIGPAWVRFGNFFPAVENPNVVFTFVGDSLILVAIARDLMAYKRVHPVYMWVGGLIFAWDIVFPFAFQSAAWLHVARWLLGEAAVSS